MWAQLFAKIDCTVEACGCMSTLIVGWDPPPFVASKEPSCACTDREVFLDLRRRHLITLFQQSSASAISLRVWVKTKLQFHSTWQTPAVQPRGSSISHLKSLRDMNPKNLYWEAEGWRSMLCSFLKLAWGSWTLPSWGHGALSLSHLVGSEGLLLLLLKDLFWGLTGISASPSS